MPVERTSSGATVITGNAIKIFQYKSAITAIGLETKGIRFRIRVKARWAEKLGMPKRSKPEAVIAKLQEEIKQLESQGV